MPGNRVTALIDNSAARRPPRHAQRRMLLPAVDFAAISIILSTLLEAVQAYYMPAMGSEVHSSFRHLSA
jgi:hypothetical protein